MATIRRLEDKDVRAIFECLHEGKPPPPRLSFQIVPVGPNGLKLSPPSYEFPDGLYVLLRPRSKAKTSEQPKAPAHMQHLVWRDGAIPPETCPWSLSGPQFPQPTAIQQRYCYPKGRAEYSNHKGGALWTMYNTNGKEDTEFRLLHVYFSAKRAVNKGFKNDNKAPMALASPPKRVKRDFHPSSMASPPSILSSPSPQLHRSPGSVATKSNRSSNSYRSSLSSEEHSCPSPPLCLEAFFPPSPGAVHRRPSLDNSNFISPVNDKFFYRNRFHPTTTSHNRGPMMPSPYDHHQPQDSRLIIESRSNKARSSMMPSPSLKPSYNSDDLMSSRSPGHDPFPCDMSSSLHDIDNAAWNHDLLNDGLHDLDLKPASVDTRDTTTQVAQSLIVKLDTFHEQARGSILSAPELEQASLTNAYATWALHVARDPLGGIDVHPDSTDNDITDAFDVGPSAIV